MSPSSIFKNGGFKDALIDWLLRQGASTILLFFGLASATWLGWYAMDTTIPSCLSQVQAGYDRNQAEYKQSIELLMEAHERDREAFRRALDR